MSDVNFYTQEVINKYEKKSTRLMDILIDIQNEYRHISEEAISLISIGLGLSEVDVMQTISFYHFFSFNTRGKYTVYLDESVAACMKGRDEIAKVFEKEAGCKFGQTTQDGLIGLYDTSCIGMSDQAPAAIINDIIFTNLTEEKSREIVAGFKAGKDIKEIAESYCDIINDSQYLKTMVNNNIRRKGPILFLEDENKTPSLKKIITLTPEQIIDEIKASNLRGRGGAGFPTGLKWEFCTKSEGKKLYVICNADEGEPGTFKDRVLLTEMPRTVFEGMAICAYAIRADEGILYLRGEYTYMKSYLENVLEDMRKENLLGKNIAGKDGFNFDIKIQMGAGAYVCGEETALIESAEGKRGEPRNRPPYPIQVGYMNEPTVVNNVETLCSVVRIIEKGSNWYKTFGTKYSTGTKLLSISGDCEYPGIYEVEWGTSIKDILNICGADNVQAVQVGGPSGICISPKQFERKIDFDDLATGGSILIIGNHRNLFSDIVSNFMHFFMEESCGSCVPCRALTPVLSNTLNKIIAGKGSKSDISDLIRYGKIMKDFNRCGLGQTAANPILSTIKHFPEKYDELVKEQHYNIYDFDLQSAVKESCDFVGRNPII